MSKPSLISPDTSLTEAWERVLNEVRTAVKSGGHPLRTLTLATLDEGIPQQRMVVLRDFSDDSVFTIYTDRRSDKVDQILNNESVSLLFYDFQTQLQLRVTGKAMIVNAGEELLQHWNNRGSKNPYSYTSDLAPGTVIENPEEAYRWTQEEPSNFCLIKIAATHMEFLQLDGVKHIRGEKIIRDRKETIRWITP